MIAKTHFYSLSKHIFIADEKKETLVFYTDFSKIFPTKGWHTVKFI